MTNKSAMRLSRVVSAVFHPCLLPIYAVITVLFSDTVYSFYTMRVKFYLIWVVVLYAAFIPMLAYFLFKRLDGLKRMSIDRSRLRMLMLMVGAVCYMLCAVTLLKLPSLLLFRKLATAAVMCEIFCIFTVRRWNVSLHLAAMGAVTALFVMLNIIGVMSLFWPNGKRLLFRCEGQGADFAEVFVNHFRQHLVRNLFMGGANEFLFHSGASGQSAGFGAFIHAFHYLYQLLCGIKAAHAP